MSLLKTGACFTAELELNCPTIVACVAALPVGPSAVAGDLVLGPDNMYHALPAAAVQVPQTISLAGNTLTLSNGGGSVTIPDLDTQDLSISGNVISLTNGGSVTLPTSTAPTLSIAGSNLSISGGNTVALPAAVTFATPAETVAGTSTTLAVNPADLYARENIPAQTGLGLVLSAIPAPTANQSVWGVNTLGEILHYAPGLGWKIVANFYGTQASQPAGTIPTPVGTWTTAVSLVAPRAGRVIVTAHVFVENSTHAALAGGLSINGIVQPASNSGAVGVFGTASFWNGGVSTHEISGVNAAVSWTGDVTAGSILAVQGITILTAGRVSIGKIEYTYLN
jgi:hypothetical protein